MTMICRFVGCSDQEAVRLTSSAASYPVNKPLGKSVTDRGAKRGDAPVSGRGFPGLRSEATQMRNTISAPVYVAVGHGAAEDPEVLCYSAGLRTGGNVDSKSSR